MDCLPLKFVNDWAVPLSKGPEAIRRLSAWINSDEKASRRPFFCKGVHCGLYRSERRFGTSKPDVRSLFG
jgi:hypothetical protein